MTDGNRLPNGPHYFGWIVESANDPQSGKIDFGLLSEPLKTEVVTEFEEIVGTIAALRPTFIDFLVLRESYLDLMFALEGLADRWDAGRLAVLDAGAKTIETHVAVERRLGAFLGTASAFRGRLEVRISDEGSDDAELRAVLARLYDRPLEARLAPARSLHDRSIQIDSKYAWITTQSFNAFAARSPATLSRLDGEAGEMKIVAYEAIWDAAKPLS